MTEMTERNRDKIRFIDLFAGCGGLEDGFLGTGLYEAVASVEWLKPQAETLRKRLSDRYGIKDADSSAMRFDIQREEEMFLGWKDDPEFGSGAGLDSFVYKDGHDGIDMIIGGPPCQAYSIAGRVRDENGMRNDYRNYLFEHYLSAVNRYRPVLFIFENVPGILSAAPDGEPIVDKIRKGFKGIGYAVTDDLRKYAKVNAADYGVPQNRERMIILGIRTDLLGGRDPQEYLMRFYKEFLPAERTERIATVGETIGDLPKFIPLYDAENHKKRRAYMQEPGTPEVSWHFPRYHNVRDMDTYRLLAEDVKSGRNEYDSRKITELYAEKVGSSSPIHRYHVLNENAPSTTVVAHLRKDGNRFIHFDPEQARSVTVREAARLQSFDDSFDFVGSMGAAYQMIGNAVPPVLAAAVGRAAAKLYFLIKEQQTEGH